MRTIAPYAKAIHLIQLEQEGSASRQFLRDCLQANEVTCPVLDAQVDKLFPKIGHCSLAKPKHASWSRDPFTWWSRLGKV